jgi:hypothetical protein
MTKDIYVKFKVEAESYEEAAQKLNEGLESLDCVIPDDSDVRDILNTRQIVNKVHI